MIPAEFDAFVGEFRRLSAALERFKQSPTELQQRADVYFHVLKRFTLAEVTAKADRWLQAETKFPKPVEWAGVIATAGRELVTMTDRESREYGRAIALHYEDAPCGCASCVEAGVSEKPLRFVPEWEEPSGRDRHVIDPFRSRVVTAGHWAHGWELFRYYDAKANFYNTCLELGLRGDVLKPTAEKTRKMTQAGRRGGSRGTP